MYVRARYGARHGCWLSFVYDTAKAHARIQCTSETERCLFSLCLARTPLPADSATGTAAANRNNNKRVICSTPMFASCGECGVCVCVCCASVSERAYDFVYFMWPNTLIALIRAVCTKDRRIVYDSMWWFSHLRVSPIWLGSFGNRRPSERARCGGNVLPQRSACWIETARYERKTGMLCGRPPPAPKEIYVYSRAAAARFVHIIYISNAFVQIGLQFTFPYSCYTTIHFYYGKWCFIMCCVRCAMCVCV